MTPTAKQLNAVAVSSEDSSLVTERGASTSGVAAGDACDGQRERGALTWAESIMEASDRLLGSQTGEDKLDSATGVAPVIARS